jgi:hypothetical protein
MRTHRLLRDLDPARREQRRPARVRGGHPAAHVLVDLHREVGVELLVQLGVGATTGEETRNAGEQRAQRVHGVSGRRVRKAAIRSAVWRQSRVSRSKRLRPAAVSE